MQTKPDQRDQWLDGKWLRFAYTMMRVVLSRIHGNASITPTNTKFSVKIEIFLVKEIIIFSFFLFFFLRLRYRQRTHNLQSADWMSNLCVRIAQRSRWIITRKWQITEREHEIGSHSSFTVRYISVVKCEAASTMRLRSNRFSLLASHISHYNNFDILQMNGIIGAHFGIIIYQFHIYFPFFSKEGLQWWSNSNGQS